MEYLTKIGCAALSVFLVCGLSGCEFTPHEVLLEPSTIVAPTSVGTGTKLSFHFVDERDDIAIGHRSVATVGAKVSAKELSSIVTNSLREGLSRKGFELVNSDADANAVITFRLKAFAFYIEEGFWSNGQETNAVIGVDALRGGRSYTNVYRFNNDKRVQLDPGGDAIDRQMNASLNSILQQALSDADLDNFLTRVP